MNLSSLKNYKYSALFITLALIAYYPLFFIYFADHDTMHMSLRFMDQSPRFYAWIQQMVQDHSRYYYYFLFPFISISYVFKNFLYFKLSSIIILLSNIISFSLLLKHFFPKKNYFLIFPYLFLLLQSYTTNHSLFTGYFPFYQILINFIVFTFIFFDKYLKDKKKKNLLWFSLFHIASILLSEVVVIYSILFFWIVFHYRNQNQCNWLTVFRSNRLLIFIIISVNIIYAASHLIARIQSQTTYPGNSFKPDKVSISGYLKTAAGYSIFNIPLIHFANPEFQKFYKRISNSHHNSLDGKSEKPSKKNKDIYLLIPFGLAVLLLGLGFLLYQSIPKRDDELSQFPWILAVLCLLLMYIPNSLHPLNYHYQEFFLSGKRWATHMSYFSRFGSVLLFTIIISHSCLHGKKLIKMLTLSLVGISIFTTQFNNFFVAIGNKPNLIKWQIVDFLQDSKDFRTVKCVYSDYLFDPIKVPYYQIGSYRGHHLAKLDFDTENYWEKYTRIHKRRTIKFSPTNTKSPYYKNLGKCLRLEIAFDYYTSNPRIILVKQNGITTQLEI